MDVSNEVAEKEAEIDSMSLVAVLVAVHGHHVGALGVDVVEG